MLGPMRYFLLSILAFVVFVASSSLSIAASCKSYYYQTECEEDAACNWNIKRGACQSKTTYVGCGSHSEFYCEANGCQWDSENRKCIDKGGTLPSAIAQPGQ
jgi:hypothetical protein